MLKYVFRQPLFEYLQSEYKVNVVLEFKVKSMRRPLQFIFNGCRSIIVEDHEDLNQLQRIWAKISDLRCIIVNIITYTLKSFSVRIFERISLNFFEKEINHLCCFKQYIDNVIKCNIIWSSSRYSSGETPAFNCMRWFDHS